MDVGSVWVRVRSDRRGDLLDEGELIGREIMELVEKEEAVPGANGARGVMIRAKEFDATGEEVVVVERIALAQEARVPFVDGADDVGDTWLEVWVRAFAWREAGEFAAAEGRSESIDRNGSPDVADDADGGRRDAQCVILPGSVEYAERRGDADGAPVVGEEAGANVVKRAGGNPGVASEGEAFAELGGGVEGERHREDVFGLAALVLEEKVDAFDDRAGLAGAGTGEDEEVSGVCGVDDDAALGVREIGVGHGPGLPSGSRRRTCSLSRSA